jgi:multidrug efflux pump subunit AcrB
MNMSRKTVSSFRIVILFLALSIVGACFIKKLPLELYSKNYTNTIKVSFLWPDTPSAYIANRVTSLLEGSFNRLNGIKSIHSTTSDGKGEIHIEFDKNRTIDIARHEISMSIRQLIKSLPENLSYPKVEILNGNKDLSKSVLSFILWGGELKNQELSDVFINIIRPGLTSIEDIQRIDVTGLFQSDYLLKINISLFDYYGIELSEINEAFQNYFERIDIGKFYETTENKVVSKNIQIKNSGFDIEKIPVKLHHGRLIRLSDICTIEESDKDPVGMYRVNGERTISISVYAKEKTNNIELSNQLKKFLFKTQKESIIPFSFKIISDSSDQIKKEMNNILKRMAISILCLLVLFLCIYNNIIHFTVLLLSLVQNILISVIIYKLFNVNINLYSLAALTVSYGIIIDNIVIMMDELKNNGNKRIITSIISSTLTTLASLVVMFFITTTEQVMFKDFSIILIINLIVSIIVTYYFIPAIFEDPWFNKRLRNNNIFDFKVNLVWKKKIVSILNYYYSQILSKILRFRAILIILLILSFGIPVYKLPIHIDKVGNLPELYNKIFGSDYYIENIRPSINTIFGGSLRLFSQYVIKNPEYDEEEVVAIQINASMQQGSSADKINKPISELESYILNFEEVNLFITEIYPNGKALINVYFNKEYENTSFPLFLQGLIIDKSIQIEGVNWRITGIGDSFDNTKQNFASEYQLYIYGYNFDQLGIYADKVKQDLLKNDRVPKVNILSIDSPIIDINQSYSFHVDKRRLLQNNLNWEKIVKNIRYKSEQQYFIASVLINGQEKDISICPKSVSSNDLWELFNIHHGNLSMDYLGEISKLNRSKKIYREKQQYRLILDFNYVGTEKFGKKWIDHVINENKKELPIGYTIKKKSLFEEQNKKIIYKKSTVFLTILIIYIICSILFNSLIQPLIVLSILPFSFIGVFLTFYLFDLDYDHGGFASFIILAGITINSNIYIINQFNQYKSELSINDSKKIFLNALNKLILPILITIVSTSTGLLPFLWGKESQYFWSSLSAGTIGGLIFSVLGIILYLPLFLIKKKDL